MSFSPSGKSGYYRSLVSRRCRALNRRASIVARVDTSYTVNSITFRTLNMDVEHLHGDVEDLDMDVANVQTGVNDLIVDVGMVHTGVMDLDGDVVALHADQCGHKCRECDISSWLSSNYSRYYSIGCK